MKMRKKDELTVGPKGSGAEIIGETNAAIQQAIDIMARGLPVGIVGRFFLYNIPYSFAFSIPISALFSTLLIFGRMSADSEISAMKSSGLSMWQIASATA